VEIIERPEDFAVRLQAIHARIEAAARRAGRDPAAVRLIAATKTVPVDRLRQAVEGGCRAFGENRVQEAVQKMDALAPLPDLEWHLIGPLQTNKAKLVVGRFALIHSIDRVEIARRLNDLLDGRGLVQAVLLEVNIAAEPSKHGVRPESLVEVAGQIAGFTAIRIRGLMTIPPPVETPDQARPHFRYLKKLALQVEQQHIPGVAMTDLSMGMSADFECAIEEGATMVRIGTRLFGARGAKGTP
jgi:PLP dependent protein